MYPSDISYTTKERHAISVSKTFNSFDEANAFVQDFIKTNSNYDTESVNINRDYMGSKYTVEVYMAHEIDNNTTT